jgi:hypothetical protein
VHAVKITLAGRIAFGEPPGRCIYCGASGERLTHEHIVAYCLAQDTYLPNASCLTCSKVTSYLEGYAGRHVFGAMRKHFRIQSRRRRRDLGTVDVEFRKSDGTTEVRAVPRDALPAVVMLPILPPPGIFHDQVPAPIAKFDPWVWIAHDLTPSISPFLRQEEVEGRLLVNINALVFARMLAKIAHAATVGWLGVDAFKPFLTPLILGHHDNAGYLVGGAAPPTEPLPPQPYRKDTLHHRMLIIPMSAAGKPHLLAVTIQLFLHIGSPTYWVIVGEPSDETLERLRVNNSAPGL